jgi:outer membrane immunogenic protein
MHPLRVPLALGRCAFAVVLNATAAVSAFAGDVAIPPNVTPDIWWLPPPPPPRFSWTGCHLGAHFGGAFGEDRFNGTFADTAIPSTPLTVVLQPAAGPPVFLQQSQALGPVALNGGSVRFPESGMIVGVQGGCDLQLAPNWLIGFDADASGANVSGSSHLTRSAAFLGSPFPATTTVNSGGNVSLKTDFLSTVTGRFGYSFERGRGLLYLKAGAAFANNSYSFGGQVVSQSCNTWVVTVATGLGTCTALNPPTTSLFNFGASGMRMGWTVGTGVEWAVLNNWSVKLEYDYLDFGSRNLTLTDSASGNASINVNQRINEVKLGVNYLFGR